MHSPQDFSLTLRNGVMEFAETRPARADIRLSLSSETLGEILTVASEGDKHSLAVTTPVARLEQAIESDKVKVEAGNVARLRPFFGYFETPGGEKFPITLK